MIWFYAWSPWLQGYDLWMIRDGSQRPVIVGDRYVRAP